MGVGHFVSGDFIWPVGGVSVESKVGRRCHLAAMATMQTHDALPLRVKDGYGDSGAEGACSLKETGCVMEGDGYKVASVLSLHA